MMILYQMSPRLRHMLIVDYLIYYQLWFVHSACLCVCVCVYHFSFDGIEVHPLCCDINVTEDI